MSAAFDRAFAEMPARAAAALRIAMQPDIEAARRLIAERDRRK